MKKSHVKKIIELNPISMYSFDSDSLHLNYDRENVYGVVLDVVSNGYMTPIFNSFAQTPLDIQFISSGVCYNDLSSNALVVGSIDKHNIYSLSYDIEIDSNEDTLESSVSMQLKIPKQESANVKIIDYTVPHVTLTFDDGSVSTNECALVEDMWVYEFMSQKQNEIVNIKVMYMGDIIHNENYTLMSSNYIPTEHIDNININNTNIKKSTSNEVTFDGMYSITNVNDKLQSDVNNNTPLNASHNVLYGKFDKRINITDYRYNNNRKTSVILKTSSILLYVMDGMITLKTNNNNNNNISYQIGYDISKNIIVTQKINMAISQYELYVDSVCVGKLLSSPNDVSIINDNKLKLGSDLSVNRVINKKDLVVYRDIVICHLDNLAFFDKVLSKNDIRELYISALTKKEFFHRLKPYTNFTFNTLNATQNSLYNNVKLYTSGGLVRESKSSFSDFKNGINFNGKCQLKTRNNKPLIKNTTEFTLLMWLNSKSSNYILLSQRDRLTKNGISIVIDEHGFVNVEINKNVISTKIKLNNGVDVVIGIVVKNKTIRLYIPNEYDETYVIDEGINVNCNTTLLHDINYNYQLIDVSFYALYTFDYAVSVDVLKEMLDVHTYFYIDGVVTFNNIQTKAKILLTDYMTGELVDTIYTDEEGNYKYKSSTSKKLLMSVFPYDGNNQLLGVIKSQSN